MQNVKLFALYLPQFHPIEENNKWWGNNYTDWEAVKKAMPLYKNHYQPRKPYRDNYYDLRDKKTLIWQANTARQYGISGFCIYHYYSNGKLMMEKPSEILLHNNDINIEFFFSWANHDFRKNWFGGDKSLLQAQSYGGADDYLAHIRYLLPFFKDCRYLKINNKPVFVIYDITTIPEYDLMIRVWEKELKIEGFDGVNIVAMKCRPNVKAFELQTYKSVYAVMPFEPLNVRSNAANGDKIYIFGRRLRTVFLRYLDKFLGITKPEIFGYLWANDQMLKTEKCGKQFYCIFPDWDNTPRYGERSVLFKGSTPELFYKYTKKFICRSQEEKAEILFINAWNEWGESAYLEPDEKNKFKYLEMVKKAVSETNIL